MTSQYISSAQLLSSVSDSLRPRGLQHTITNSPSLLKLMSIESVMPSHFLFFFFHLIFCRPLLLPSSIFPSIRVFSNEVSTSHQVVKVLELQLLHQSFQ